MKSKIIIQTIGLTASLLCGLAFTAQAQTIINGGFEAGLAGWTTADFVGSDGTFFVQSGTSTSLNGFTVPAPPEGTNAAMTDQGAGGAHILYQDFTVPTGPLSGTLGFSLFLNSGASFVSPTTLDWSATNRTGGLNLNQQARVDILTTTANPFSVASGDVLQNIYRTNPGDPLTAGYFSMTSDITSLLLAHQGQTLRLRFAEVDNISFLNLGVDRVSLVVVPEPSSMLFTLSMVFAFGGSLGYRKKCRRVKEQKMHYSRNVVKTRVVLLLLCLVALASLAPSVQAQILTVNSLKDNTIYEESTNSNGAGESFFSGNTSRGGARRALLAFNVSSIPANSVITGVSLTLHVAQTNAGNETMGLHRLLANWGEGTSNSGGAGGGRGAAPSTGDATWQHRFFNTSTWATPGGDFVAAASATTTVRDVGSFTWDTTSSLVTDVQGWVNTPGTNFGWILTGDEVNLQTAKRFDSRESTTASFRPVLNVHYTVAAVPGPQALPLFVGGLGAIMTIARRRRQGSGGLSIV